MTAACVSALPGDPRPTATATAIGVTPSPSPSIPPPTPLTITTSDYWVEGQWVTGTSGAPTVAPFLSCSDYGVWKLSQAKESVVGIRAFTPESGTMAIKFSLPIPHTHLEVVEGTYVAGRLKLNGTVRPASNAAGSDAPSSAVAYDLTYDTRTNTLGGTRNGTPFWAVPTVKGTDVWPLGMGAGAPPICR